MLLQVSRAPCESLASRGTGKKSSFPGNVTDSDRSMTWCRPAEQTPTLAWKSCRVISEPPYRKTHPVYAGNFEAVGSSTIVGAVHIVTHHQNHVEECFKLDCVFQIMTCILEQRDPLPRRVAEHQHRPPDPAAPYNSPSPAK